MISRARRSTLGLLTLPLCLLLALGAGPTVTSANAADDEPTWEVPVRVATYNFKVGRPVKKFRKAIDQLKERIDVAGLQETRARGRNAYLESFTAWGSYRPADTSPNPVIWNKRVFRFLKGRAFLMAHGRNIRNERIAGRGVYHDSYATIVRFQHILTGKKVSVINVHLAAGAVRQGRPWPGRPRLFKMYRQQVVRLVKAQRIERKWGEVYVVGDLNVGYDSDKVRQRHDLPFKRLTRQGMTSMWRDYDVSTGGTRNDSYIDQVWSKHRASDAVVARDIRGSDHLPAIATYTYDVLPSELPELSELTELVAP